MKTQKALDIIQAMQLLADTLDLTFLEVGQRICFMDSAKADVIREAADIHNAFLDASIPERGAMLGIEITECDGGYTSEIVLSEREDPPQSP